MQSLWGPRSTVCMVPKVCLDLLALISVWNGLLFSDSDNKIQWSTECPLLVPEQPAILSVDVAGQGCEMTNLGPYPLSFPSARVWYYCRPDCEKGKEIGFPHIQCRSWQTERNATAWHSHSSSPLASCVLPSWHVVGGSSIPASFQKGLYWWQWQFIPATVSIHVWN